MLGLESWIHHAVYELEGGTLFRSECVGMMPIAGGGLRVDPSLSFNARISRSDEIISVNLGVISALTIVALTASEDMKLVAAIMSPGSTTGATAELFQWPQDPFSEDQGVISESWKRPVPDFGSAQWFVFTNVFYGALRFVLIHEQAHLVQGHVPYAAQLGFSEDFLELGPDNLSGQHHPRAAFRRVLEHDADRFAFHFLLMPFMPYFEGADHARLKEVLLEGGWRFIASFCGACLCFAALANRDSDGRHPSATYRLRQALVNMQATVNFQNDFTNEEIDQITARLIPPTALIFSKFGITRAVIDAWQTLGAMPENHALAAEHDEAMSLSRDVLPQLRAYQGIVKHHVFWGGVQP